MIKLFDNFIQTQLFFHSSETKFDKFNFSYVNGVGLKYGYGIYFSKDRNHAKIYHSNFLYTCKLNTNNFVDWSDYISDNTLKKIKPILKKLDIKLNKYDKCFSTIYLKIKNRILDLRYPNDIYDNNAAKDTTQLLLNVGINGTYFENEYCVFDPNDILILKIEKI
jgi:hypothetical protein